jgi:hypothetical protein
LRIILEHDLDLVAAEIKSITRLIEALEAENTNSTNIVPRGQVALAASF